MEISSSKSAAFGFFFLSLQLLTLSVCVFHRRDEGGSAVAALVCSKRVWVSRWQCHVKEILLYQRKFNLRFMQSGYVFLSLDLAVVVSFSHLPCIQTVVCWKEYYYF